MRRRETWFSSHYISAFAAKPPPVATLAMRPPRARDAPGASPSASSDASDASDSHPPPEPPLTFQELLPADVDSDVFLDRTWYESVETWTVPDDVLRRLRAGFCGGDTSAVVRRCRDEHNRAYDASDAADFAARFDAGDTLNLPFCFTRGASQLKNDILRRAYNADDEREGALECANDVEVGVYVSPEKGAEARWHHDNNHNVTVQLWGVKEWRTSPSGNPNVLTSRGLNDPPRTMYDKHALHPPNLTDHLVTRLAPGQAIYVPPGEWHRVIPIETDPTVGSCFSVDVRVASVTHARWTCEALFASMTCGGIPGATRIGTRDHCARLGYLPQPLDAYEQTPSSALRGAINGGAWGGGPERTSREWVGVKEHLRACQRVARWMSGSGAGGDSDSGDDSDSAQAFDAKRDDFFPPTWFPPRAMPFEDALSDGMDLGATLGFLVDELDEGLPDEFANRYGMGVGRRFTILPHAMVAMTKHPVSGGEDGDEDWDGGGDGDGDENGDDENGDDENGDDENDGDASDEDVGFLLRLRATSNLTNMDYARFTIACPPGIDPEVVRALTRRANEPFAAPRVPKPGATRDLLNVLAHARFVWIVQAPKTAVSVDDPGSQVASKTRKRARS